METYPIVDENGLKLVAEDLEDGWELAGKAGDKVLAQLAQIPVSSGDRVGYVVPIQDGPIVVPNGASGTVEVRPFYAYRGPSGVETTRDLLSAYFASSDETVPTPLPSSGNHRWDLLYAIVSETDSDAESRMVEDPVTEVVAAQLVNTRHKSVVTLAWVQGTPESQATTPYTAANWPALPAPASGQAHVPLAYIHVVDDGSPATVTYSVDRIANAPTNAPANPQTGVAPATFGGLAYAAAGACVVMNDPKDIATTAGGWDTTSSAERPPHFIEPIVGERQVTIALDLQGASLVGSSWTIISTKPLFSQDSSDPVHRLNPWVWRNRMFWGWLWLGSKTAIKWAHDRDGGAAALWPTHMPTSGGADGIMKQPRAGMGNTIRHNPDFDTESSLTSGAWYVAFMVRDVLGAGAMDDLAVLVCRTAHSVYAVGDVVLAAREATTGAINGRVGLLTLTASAVPFEFNY